MSVVPIKEFLKTKIASNRDKMQDLIVESKILIDSFDEHRSNLGKIIQARDLLNKAIKHNNNIKHYQKILNTIDISR